MDEFDEIIFNDLDDDCILHALNDLFELNSMSGYEHMMGLVQQYIEYEQTYGHLEDAADEAAGVSEYDAPDIGW